MKYRYLVLFTLCTFHYTTATLDSSDINEPLAEENTIAQQDAPEKDEVSELAPAQTPEGTITSATEEDTSTEDPTNVLKQAFAFDAAEDEEDGDDFDYGNFDADDEDDADFEDDDFEEPDFFSTNAQAFDEEDDGFNLPFESFNTDDDAEDAETFADEKDSDDFFAPTKSPSNSNDSDDFDQFADFQSLFEQE